MKKVKLNRTLIEDIPSPIIFDILLKLPTKACLNCKLVCKDWYEIIISNEFATLRSSFCSYTTIMLYGKFNNGRLNYLLIDLDKSSKVDDMYNLCVSEDHMIRFKSKLNIAHHKLHVVNQCNGLICLKCYRQWSPYFIINLLTSEQIIVQQPKVSSCSLEAYGFGQCPVSQQFKILRIIKDFKARKKHIAQVQTLGTNEWRTLSTNAPQSHLRRSQAFLQGALHWCSEGKNFIWSFNFSREKFSRILVPDSMKGRKGTDVISVSNNTHLCLINKCEMWVMKEYGVKDSWVKQFVYNNHVCGTGPATPLVLVYNYGGSYKLGVYDIESETCKKVTIPDFSTWEVMVFDAKFSVLKV
ncbi:F-box protein At3g07870-like [Beta vulgaris subsp. vulgaris]|uniref:F-box protein At3g07870-like n=1 Tax=Beta vulgaris subsp. vulgaris TaxID=3555 RepID=UPI00254794B2|nr:F-box protein At3g07870-like [Beta vulgaris subsp. vulgaris]